jgi:lipoprotein-releasing system permease protein
VVGIGKDEEGHVDRPAILYEAWVKLTVLGVTESAATFDPAAKAERNYWIVDDSRTQMWQYDSNTVYVPFEVLQVDLGMQEQRTDDGEIIPARATDIQIKIKPGVSLEEARDKIDPIVKQVFRSHEVPTTLVKVETWAENQRLWINAIEKEVVLVTFLFGVISVVAVFLIFCIFYMIVVEKTKDIGIIKSVGATSQGVAGIFLGYGLAIGIVGSLLGLLAAWLIVHNINWLHEQLARQLGFHMWDPQVYAFDTIPNTMDWNTVSWIVAIAIAASVVGALVPAIRAARLNPVEALRWE